MENAVLQDLIKGCLSNKREHQKKLYKAFYGFAYNIVLRYADEREEASIIMNKGFYNVFTSLRDYKEITDFTAWLRNLMVRAGVEYYLNKRRPLVLIPESKTENINSDDFNLNGEVSFDNAVNILRQLPYSCRIVFNLFVIDGYSHEKIEGLLGMPVYTSESLLKSARKILKSLLSAQNGNISRCSP
jgi:RNA polymerase sigma factor (sigma-70 family)